MPIESYVGVPFPCINVETVEELYEALDLLHTQVMDNLGEDMALLTILSDAMDRVQAVTEGRCPECGVAHAPHANSLCDR